MILENFDEIHNEDGSILLVPKKKRQRIVDGSFLGLTLETKLDSKNNFYRTDEMSNNQYNNDGEERVKLAIYQLENAWRSDSDPLKYKPREKVTNSDSSAFDSSYERYKSGVENAYKS